MNDYDAYAGKELMNREKCCSNPWENSIGPFFEAMMGNSNGDIYWMECQIPRCEAIEQNIPRTTYHKLKHLIFLNESRNSDY